MTTVSREDSVNTVPLFIRDVLRENLTDTQTPARTTSTWIFKGSTEQEFNPPIVFIDDVRTTEKTFNVRKSKRHAIIITMIIRVWADKLVDRDTLADQIRTVLCNYDNTDGTNSIASQGLVIDGITSRNIDVSATSYEEPIKIKRVSEISIGWVLCQ